MHDAARQFVSRHASSGRLTALECGARDVNGTVRDLFPHTTWVGVDVAAGAGVDVVADFADYTHPEPVDLVVSTEVLEHTSRWRDILRSAARNLRPGGHLIVTAASHGRAPHSAVDGGPVGPDEHYENIDPDELSEELARWFTVSEVFTVGEDVQAVAEK
jgi:SAM-dependent methyltransferase